MTDQPEVDPRTVIADAIANTAPDLAASVDTQDAMCTSWVLIAEWTDSDGRWWMSTLSDPSSPSWRKRGLLNEALADSDGDNE